MATMVKEKRKEKKKSKEKSTRRNIEPDPITMPNESTFTETEMQGETSQIRVDLGTEIKETMINKQSNEVSKPIDLSQRIEDKAITNTIINENTSLLNIDVRTFSDPGTSNASVHLSEGPIVITDADNYEDLRKRFKNMRIPEVAQNVNMEQLEIKLNSPLAYLAAADTEARDKVEYVEEAPSAPVFEEEVIEFIPEPMIIEHVPRVQCLDIEEAVQLFAGREIAEVRALSDKEEMIVEAGPVSGPEHPLVDLLSTFRSSLRAQEREQKRLQINMIEEEKYRNNLWKIEKRTVHQSERCPCGLRVDFTGTYEHAEFLQDRMPVARMKLEGLLRDYQESYCHHLHLATLTHCQIEVLVSETIQSNKLEIREALSLILQAMRFSDDLPQTYAAALERWAIVLAAALVDASDVRQTLFLFHHLLRQNRSVQWAARVLRLSAPDVSSAAKTLALLETILAKPRLDSSLECTEDTEEWEELDKSGDGGAVGEGKLREKDLLALLYAFPLRDIVARVVLFTHSDISMARPHEWGDWSGGRQMFKACCGVRTILRVVALGIGGGATEPGGGATGQEGGATGRGGYVRVRAALRAFALSSLRALAALKEQTYATWSPDLRDKLSAECEECFCAGLELVTAGECPALPTTLLTDDAARDYCDSLIVDIHDSGAARAGRLRAAPPAAPCALRVRAAASAATERGDVVLANLLLEFLFQTGIKRTSPVCNGACAGTARESIPPLLEAHPFLYTTAFHLFADICQAESIDPSYIKFLSVEKWRPSCVELDEVVADWSQRCAQLLPQMLLQLDYTPQIGVSLATQLHLGARLCTHVAGLSAPPEWAWSVLRRLRVHRSLWGGGDAPPGQERGDAFGLAFELLASEWGHSLQLICSHGVPALCRLASTNYAMAIHCLAPIMLVLTQSPESVSLTPGFNQLFSTLVSAGPSLMQRTFGRATNSGPELLAALVDQLQAVSAGAGNASAMTLVWLHALGAARSAPALATLERALGRRARPGEAAGTPLEDPASVRYIVSQAAQGPRACRLALRARGSRQARLCERMLAELSAQATPHVDNALKQLGQSMSSEDLVIYQTANALLTAPILPASLELWAFFMQMFLQRTPSTRQSQPRVVGLLYFSGIFKSRTLSQLKRRLQEFILFYKTEAETLKAKEKDPPVKPPVTKPKPKPKPEETGLFPPLAIADLVGEETVDDTASDELVEDEVNAEMEKTRLHLSQLICYYVSAENMLRKFSEWIEAGDGTRAEPCHADIDRFISDQAMEAGERDARCPSVSAEFPLPREAPPPAPRPHRSPLNNAVMAIRDIPSPSRGAEIPTLKPIVEATDVRDRRSLLKLIDRLLGDLEKLMNQWSECVGRVSTLDAALWTLVVRRRVSRAPPPVRRACAGRCPPVTIVLQVSEYCISMSMERAIDENRRAARGLLPRLGALAHAAARLAACSLAAPRRLTDPELALQLVERAWQSAARAANCPIAETTLNAFVTLVAERWLCSDAQVCSSLVTSWSRRAQSPPQRALVSCVVNPRMLRREHWSRLYQAVLKATLPPDDLFRHLSQFEVSRWSEGIPAQDRADVLDALLQATSRGVCPGEDCQVLVELLGVHTCALLTAHTLAAYVCECARAALCARLPAPHWLHAARAAARAAPALSLAELGHILRSLGETWWAGRCEQSSSRSHFILYAPHVASLSHTLQRAFVAAAIALSYNQERVSLYAWSSLIEAWSAWVSPHGAPPLLPLEDVTQDDVTARDATQPGPYALMLRRFVDNLHQIMLDCPGCEPYLLQYVFEWTVTSYIAAVAEINDVTSHGTACVTSRAALTVFLAELAKLPWQEHQWYFGKSLQTALQMRSYKLPALGAWLGAASRGTRRDTLLRDVTHADLPQHLAVLLCLLCASDVQYTVNLIDQACELPWSNLPEEALQEACDRFFMEHYESGAPYHEAACFRLLLSASELSPAPLALTSSTVSKRACFVSAWTRAANEPGRDGPSQVECQLRVLSDAVAPGCEQDDIEDLLGRVALLLCVDSTGDAAIPVWINWVSHTTERLTLACLSAVTRVTSFKHFAALTDAAVKANLQYKESSWSHISGRLRACSCRGRLAALLPARAHAAVALAGDMRHKDARAAASCLLTDADNFVENELIYSVWVVLLTRVSMTGDPSETDVSECRTATHALVAKWSEGPRLALLRVLITDKNSPTDKLRLISRLALCTLSPSDSAARQYETGCASLAGSMPDAAPWGRTPGVDKLVRLATRLFPNCDRYFDRDIQCIGDSVS